MFFFNNSEKEHRPFTLLVSCPEQGLTFWGTTRDISSQDFSIEVPTTRIKVSLMEFINKNVIIRFENVTISGSLHWYTIERDYYIINIAVCKQCRAAWKELVNVSDRLGVKAAGAHQTVS